MIRHHNFVSSIIGITYIWESYFTLRSEKNHFDTILVSRSATQSNGLHEKVMISLLKVD